MQTPVPGAPQTPPAAQQVRQRRVPSPYSTFRASTTPEDMARLARSISPAAPAAAAGAAAAPGAQPGVSPGAGDGDDAAPSPYLSEPQGFPYRPAGAAASDGLLGGLLPKYHFSVSWSTRKAAEAGGTTAAPSGPQQIDDVLHRLSVDRDGLRCATCLGPVL